MGYGDLSVLGQFSEILGRDDTEAVLGELLGYGDDGAGDMESILGGDDMSVLGALLRPSGARAARALKAAAAARKLRDAAIVTHKDPVQKGVWPLGLRTTAPVVAGTSGTATTRPQVLYKPMRLVVPASIASFFTIDDVKVGNRSQFPSADPVPAEMFTQTAEAVVLELDTVNPAIDLIVDCTNIGLADLQFRAAFVGKAVG